MGDTSRQRGSAAGTVVLMKHPASIRVRMPFATTAAHCCHFIICPPLTSALLTSITTTSSCLTTAFFTSSHITAAHNYHLAASHLDDGHLCSATLSALLLLISTLLAAFLSNCYPPHIFLSNCWHSSHLSTSVQNPPPNTV